MEARGLEGSMSKREEVVVAFQTERRLVPHATHFRSTWLTSSQATLRAHGYFAQYERHVAPELKQDVLGMVAGQWLPMRVAMAHYEACDRLQLSTEELVAVGEAATRRANATSLEFVVRLATAAGADVWTVFAQAQRMWERTCRGGAVAVFKLGPKEARIEVAGYPLSRYRYNRVTMRGIISGIAGLFCSKLYIHEIGSQCTTTDLTFRVSWA
jgi:hypothetical protein